MMRSSFLAMTKLQGLVHYGIAIKKIANQKGLVGGV